ncbi:MAG: DUF624 domain-containing protein [Eubacteriales bacterium]|nr:DUF624 domain-containing protein [Eubacteriales bacterium]
MKNIFRPDSPLMLTMTQITDCIFLSLFWMLGCFPVVSAGAATAALYDAAFRCYRRGEKHPWQRFFHCFRQNFLPGLLPTVVFLAALGAMGFGLIQLWNRAVYGEISWMLFSGVAFLAMAALGVLSVLFPLLSRFENSFGGLMKNTVLLALANLPRTMVLGLLNMVTIGLCLRFVFPLFFLPALTALVSSLLLEPMFRPFMPEEK